MKSNVDLGTAGHFLNNDADSVWVSAGTVAADGYTWDYTVNP